MYNHIIKQLVKQFMYHSNKVLYKVKKNKSNVQ